MVYITIVDEAGNQHDLDTDNIDDVALYWVMEDDGTTTLSATITFLAGRPSLLVTGADAETVVEAMALPLEDH